ncbi:Hypothetical protein (plasmid) [Pseudomonas putida]|nr:Hypothetical protein [Pseudomonas putida]
MLRGDEVGSEQLQLILLDSETALGRPMRCIVAKYGSTKV